MAHKQTKHLQITITGTVQGVFFRASTKAVADQLGVKGIVLNQPDGSVYLEAEGDEFALGQLLEWCHEGPDKAQVDKVTTREAAVKNYRNFEVVNKLQPLTNKR